MKSVEDFVLWAITDCKCFKVPDLIKKLSVYGFEKQEVELAINNLFKDNKIQLFNGMIGRY